MNRRRMISSVFQKREKSNVVFNRIVDEFLSMQRGKGNAEQTIKHYERSAKKIKRFLCWYPQFCPLRVIKRLRVCSKA